MLMASEFVSMALAKLKHTTIIKANEATFTPSRKKLRDFDWRIWLKKGEVMAT